MTQTAYGLDEVQHGRRGEWLAAQLARAWQRGERPSAEQFLNPCAELEPEDAVRLIYEEVCQRQERGEAVDAEELAARFPHWAGELALLLDCHQLVDARLAPPDFPVAGKWLGDFLLIRELGRGQQSRVFLARQATLADRPVVLKMTARQDGEALRLARLQHTNIIPLHGVHDDPERNLQILCEPYLGGATLASVLDALQSTPAKDRTGAMIVEALDRLSLPGPMPPARGPRQTLAQMEYAEAIAWIGACLADGLHYAHERGLLHLDLKASNVLLAADGQPLLLDFHLAGPPLAGQRPAPDGLGGTLEDMSPEQRAAYDAADAGLAIPAPVDARSDVYALGRLLYLALGGDTSLSRLERCNPRVTPGLADIFHRCLAATPANRYHGAAAVAADLRRHLAHQPLRGVSNRSLRERWQKWRRRKPVAPVWISLFLALAAFPLLMGASILERVREAEAAVAEGRRLAQQGAHAEAIATLARGKTRLAQLPGTAGQRTELDAWLTLARRGEATAKLHAVCERLRFLAGTDALSEAEWRNLDAHCAAVWGAIADLPLDEQARADVIDLAVIWTDLGRRHAPGDASRDAVLAEAESRCGRCAALSLQRGLLCGEDGIAPPPRTFGDHAALGRALLRAGRLAEAAKHLSVAREMRPGDFWVHFDAGTCAHRRGRYGEAIHAFDIAAALAPRQAEVYHNRALANAASGANERAISDYDRALALAPTLTAAALNRGIHRYQAGQHTQALADLRQALRHGAAPAAAHYNLALVHLALEELAEARSHVEHALRHEPGHAGASDLRRRLGER